MNTSALTPSGLPFDRYSVQKHINASIQQRLATCRESESLNLMSVCVTQAETLTEIKRVMLHDEFSFEKDAVQQYLQGQIDYWHRITTKTPSSEIYDFATTRREVFSALKNKLFRWPIKQE